MCEYLRRWACLTGIRRIPEHEVGRNVDTCRQLNATPVSHRTSFKIRDSRFEIPYPPFKMLILSPSLNAGKCLRER